MPKILVVDDEPCLVEALDYALNAEGFTVVTTDDGQDALARVERERPDLIVLDLMLPGLSGTEVCKRVRATSDVPIIMLTAKDAEVDRIVGLEVGADDCVTKPFSSREPLARIRAVLRRGTDSSPSGGEPPVEAAGVRIDVDRYEVTVRDARPAAPQRVRAARAARAQRRAGADPRGAHRPRLGRRLRR